MTQTKRDVELAIQEKLSECEHWNNTHAVSTSASRVGSVLAGQGQYSQGWVSIHMAGSVFTARSVLTQGKRSTDREDVYSQSGVSTKRESQHSPGVVSIH